MLRRTAPRTDGVSADAGRVPAGQAEAPATGIPQDGRSHGRSVPCTGHALAGAAAFSRVP